MRIQLECNRESGGGTDREGIGDLLTRHGATIVDDSDDAERIVVCGGDGTIGPAAELAARRDLPLAVLASGTANDFARALGLPVELEAAARLAATGTSTRELELGRADERPFVNVVAAGLAPAAARYAAPLKRMLGPAAYPAGALAAGVRDRPVRCTISADEQPCFDGEAWQLIVACTGAFGGGSEIDVADPGDGRLDLLVVPAGRRAELPALALAMRRGTLAQRRRVLHHRARTVTIAFPDRTSFNVDGEVLEARSTVAVMIGERRFRVVIG